jgi:hypothetical protein
MQDADDRPRPKVLGGFNLAANLHPSIRDASMYARTIYDAGKVRCESCGVTVEFQTIARRRWSPRFVHRSRDHRRHAERSTADGLSAGLPDLFRAAGQARR